MAWPSASALTQSPVATFCVGAKIRAAVHVSASAAAHGIVLTELHTSRPSLESQYLAAIGGER